MAPKATTVRTEERPLMAAGDVCRTFDLKITDLDGLVEAGFVEPTVDGLFDLREVRSAVTAWKARQRSEEREVEQYATFKALLGSVEKIVSNYHKPTVEILELWQKECKRLAERNDALETKRTELITEFETIRAKEREAQLAETIVKAGIARRDATLDIFKKAVPIVLGQVKDTIVKRNIVTKLLESLDPAQLQVLATAEGFLTAEQRALLQEIVAKMTAAKEGSAAAQSATSEEAPKASAETEAPTAQNGAAT